MLGIFCYKMDEYKEEIVLTAKGSFGIQLNANDFFSYACADTVILDPLDFRWAMPIIRKYPSNGEHAVMCKIAKQMPIEEWDNDELKQAIKEIDEMDIKIYSVY